MSEHNANEASQVTGELEEKPNTENNEGLQWLVERLVGGFIGLCVVCFLIALLPTQPELGHRKRTPCLNNLRQISIAMANYSTENMHFPPAYIADETGKPIHSWRVLLLPHLEREDLFLQYSFEEPWNGPNNSKLHDEIVSVYQCPSASRGEQGRNSNYMLITGKGTAFDGDHETTALEVGDGLSNTVMIVEVSNSDTHWMEPVDLPLAQALARFSDPAKAKQCCNHPNEFNISLMDASTHSIEFRISAEKLKAFATIDGGEVIDVTDL